MSNLAALATTIRDRIATNLPSSFSSLSAQQWIRLVVVIGAYALLRPYLLKLAARSQMQAHEAASAGHDYASDAQISPNQLRGGASKKQNRLGIAVPEDSDGDGGGGQTSAADWGTKARRRQREVVKRLLDEHEKRLQDHLEDEEDEDIKEFLVE